jgi:hypothetical protein
MSLYVPMCLVWRCYFSIPEHFRPKWIISKFACVRPSSNKVGKLIFHAHSFSGWHSAVISQYDDLYMFGWNESGQLAMPTNLVSCFSRQMCCLVWRFVYWMVKKFLQTHPPISRNIFFTFYLHNMWRSSLLANWSLSQAAPALQLVLAKLDGFKLVNKQ